MTDTALGFVQNPLDRAHVRRTDDAWLATIRTQQDARHMVIAGEEVLYRVPSNPGRATALFAESDAQALTPVADELFLGFDASGLPVFARVADGETSGTKDTEVEALDMRSLVIQGILPEAETSMAALARSLGLWHRTHRFCSRCGLGTKITLGGFRRDCPACGAQHFPRTDPVVIMLVTDGDRAMIARSARFASSMYSTIAGFMEPGETIEQAVARETVEETGLLVGTVRYIMSQPWPFPSSLMIGCFAEATTTDIQIDPEELEDAIWATRSELAAAFDGKAHFTLPPPMAIAHHLIRTYLADAG